MKETVSDGAHEVRWGVDSRGKVHRTGWMSSYSSVFDSARDSLRVCTFERILMKYGWNYSYHHVTGGSVSQLAVDCVGRHYRVYRPKDIKGRSP